MGKCFRMLCHSEAALDQRCFNTPTHFKVLPLTHKALDVQAPLLARHPAPHALPFLQPPLLWCQPPVSTRPVESPFLLPPSPECMWDYSDLSYCKSHLKINLFRFVNTLFLLRLQLLLALLFYVPLCLVLLVCTDYISIKLNKVQRKTLIELGCLGEYWSIALPRGL